MRQAPCRLYCPADLKHDVHVAIDIILNLEVMLNSYHIECSKEIRRSHSSGSSYSHDGVKYNRPGTSSKIANNEFMYHQPGNIVT